jgi:hypothetical protein
MKTPCTFSFLSAVSAILLFHSLHAAEVRGRLLDGTTNEAIPFASVALFDSTSTNLAAGTTTNDDGHFKIKIPHTEIYVLRFSSLGYETVHMTMDMRTESDSDLGDMHLWPSTYLLDLVTVETQKIRGRAEGGNITYLVNRNMESASHTGVDVLKLIPGISFDISQQISLEGNHDIIILVDGRERDRSYISRLRVTEIEKIEVMTTPPAQYNASGVISIITRRNSNAGLQGHIYAELPASRTEMFIFPNYSLSYGRGRVNLFTSYSGEMLYFNIVEKYERNHEVNKIPQNIVSRQDILQKNWSHKFHFGTDYFINSRNQLNFYGWYNPFSHEHDGRVNVIQTGQEPAVWQAERDDDDISHSGYLSLFYRHFFNKSNGHEFNAYIDGYGLKGRNNTLLNHNDDLIHNLGNPRNLNHSARLNYAAPLLKRVRLFSGLEFRNRRMWDFHDSEFKAENGMLALYSTLYFGFEQLEISAGVRYENTRRNQGDILKEVLPDFSAGYRFSPQQSLRFSHRAFVQWPGIYRLNPVMHHEDPFSIINGNPQLNPEHRNATSLEYNLRPGQHLLTARLFHNTTKGAINFLTVVDENGIFQTTPYNLGNLSHTGVQFSGAIGIGKIGGIQPFFRFFEVKTKPGAPGMEHGVAERRQFAYSSGISAFAAMGRGYSAAMQMKYATPLNNLQDNYFEGLQYFLSLEKSIGNNMKAGVTGAMPFLNQYNYRGSEIETPEFYSHSAGYIQMSTVPLWFKLSWQFNSGEKRTRINRSTDALEEKRTKGFGL